MKIQKFLNSSFQSSRARGSLTRKGAQNRLGSSGRFQKPQRQPLGLRGSLALCAGFMAASFGGFSTWHGTQQRNLAIEANQIRGHYSSAAEVMIPTLQQAQEVLPPDALRQASSQAIWCAAASGAQQSKAGCDKLMSQPTIGVTVTHQQAVEGKTPYTLTPGQTEAYKAVFMAQGLLSGAERAEQLLALKEQGRGISSDEISSLKGVGNVTFAAAKVLNQGAEPMAVVQVAQTLGTSTRAAEDENKFRDSGLVAAGAGGALMGSFADDVAINGAIKGGLLERLLALLGLGSTGAGLANLAGYKGKGSGSSNSVTEPPTPGREC
jgi:hypothetical protein